jgi:hypothetical protein
LLGEYKAKRIDTPGAARGYIPTHSNGFEIFRLYDLLMPDGSTREFFVAGLGADASPEAAPRNP